MSAPASEEAATADFGDIADVSRCLAAEIAVVETRLASAFAFGAVALFVLPLYVVPENTLPPAPWAEKPRDLLALQIVAVALWGIAAMLAGIAAMLSWTRVARLAARALGVALVALAGSAVTCGILVVRWFAAALDTLLWPLLAAPLALGCVWACAEAAGWAHSRRCRLTPTA